ncbi:MAG: transposase [Candidatus Methanoperedenaceae archaeon]|nr:transposase [Candidatus Methanoperedenaceae archaeon]
MIDEILAGIKSKTVKKKEQELRDAVKNSLDPAKILLIRNYLELMEEIEKKIKKLDIEIMSRIVRMKEDVEIAMSIPGIAFISASAILAEIGNYRDFKNGEKLAAWCGLTPRVSQSADMLVTGSITKQGSKHVRRMAKKGTKKAAVALARKVLCVLHHLLINREKYQENGNAKSKPVKFDWTSSQIQMTEQDMINVLANAGYIIKKKDARGCI